MNMVRKTIARLSRLVCIFLFGAICQDKFAMLKDYDTYLIIMFAVGAVSGILAFVCEWILEFTNKSEG